MQAEASGAGYAIYWQQSGDVAEVAGYYTTPAYMAEVNAAGKSFGFAEACESVLIPTTGKSSVAQVRRTLLLSSAQHHLFPTSSHLFIYASFTQVLRTRKPVYVQDVLNSPSKQRRGIAEDYFIESVAYLPILGGVLE